MQSPFSVVICMNNGCELLKKHVEVPINKIRPIVISFFEPKPDFIVSLFFHIERHFDGPTLHDLAEIISILELEEFEID